MEPDLNSFNLQRKPTAPQNEICLTDTFWMSGDRSNRSGIAPLEFALCLPLLILFVALFFFVTSAVVTRVTTSIEARNNAFIARYETGTGKRPGSQAFTKSIDVPAAVFLDRIRGSLRRDAGGEALTTGLAEHKAPPIVSIFAPFARTAIVRAFVLTDSWDFRTLPFEWHARMSVGEGLVRFGFDPGSLELFKSLVPAGAGTHSGDLGKEKSSVSEAAKSAREGIAELTKEIERYRDELARLEAESPRDEEAISRLNDHIHAAKRTLQGLEDALKILEAKSR